MKEQRWETNDAPQVVVTTCSGKLVVGSWRETAVSAQSDALTIEQTAPNTVQMTAVGDLYLAVPQNASLTLGILGGSLTIKHISGGITVDDVAGRVTLRNVDAITISHAAQAVQGDNINGLLVVEEAGGAVDLRSVNGVQINHALADVTLQFVTGHVTLGQVAGKLDVRTVNGDVAVAQVWGDVILANLGGQVQLPAAAQSVWLAGGLASGAHRLAAANVYVYWPPDAPLNLTARGVLVAHDLPLENETTTLENGQTVLTGHIEDGKVDLFVQAAQRAAFKALTNDPPQFTESDFQFAPPSTGEDQADLVTAVRAVFAELAAELPPTTLAQLAAVRLEERVITAVTAAPSTPPAEPQASPSTVTDEQRHILQLLKDGLLSVAQAQLLLGAL